MAENKWHATRTGSGLLSVGLARMDDALGVHAPDEERGLAGCAVAPESCMPADVLAGGSDSSMAFYIEKWAREHGLADCDCGAYAQATA